MQKIFVLDTNVLLHDPRALLKFEDNDVVLPIHVIEEVDTFKKELTERGRNARHLARLLDDFRAGGSLQSGIALEGGGILRVHVPQEMPRTRLDNAGMDQAIMGTALKLRDAHPDKPVVFVTMDSNLRIRADALGLRAENYEGGRIDLDRLYSGISEVRAPAGLVDQLAGRDPVSLAGVEVDVELHPNACIVLRDVDNPKHSALGRYDAGKQAVVPIRPAREGVWAVRPRNKEQHFALDLLLDPEVHLVTLVGKAGTGKTLLAIAAGLKAIIDDGSHARLLVSRPIFPLGRDVGYLPGTLEEKLNPWMKPIFDNLEYIFHTGRVRAHGGRDYAELVASGVIEVEALTYIRGRSLPNQFLIVDEAQNLTPHEVKTIITRCGAETKLVLTGDPAQIDNPYVDAASNGLSIVAERFKQERIAAHVTLVKGERSELAERATELL
ncbi:MAG TPA: PhoH family protein [Polyangiaceae bacterium LLY-WYZ-14_1]|nr:PhoH family protein [Polyangiaceae bacterium LLY-WYZ-14_1]